MTKQMPHRGGAPVGYLSELGPVEAGAVLYLRLWCEGESNRLQVLRDFQTALGDQNGEKAVRSFHSLCSLCVHHGRRPLMRHGVSCNCLGADESCFANFIGYATDGENEDALMMATTIVEAGMAPMLVSLAKDFGLALRRMALKAGHHTEISTTIH